MDRKINVTQGAVNAACEQLMKEGKDIRKNAVIGIVGGSFSTVGPMVDTWKENQTAKDIPVIEMPETVAKAMHRATVDIWGAASTLAGERVERMRQETEDVLTKAKAALAEYAGEVARLENELEQAGLKARDTEKSRDEALAQILQLTATSAALEARLSDRDRALERLRADYEKLQAELIEIAKSTKVVTKGKG